jgi:hypothetical protein
LGAGHTFADYPANVEKLARNATVKLRTRDDKAFRTNLIHASQKPANFAGHYVLTTIGCGASCILTSAIDIKTGRVFWIPDTLCCWDDAVTEPVAFHADSRLLVLEGRRNEKTYGTWYWKMTSAGFRLVDSKLTESGGDNN